MANSYDDRLWQERSLPKYDKDPVYVEHLKVEIEVGTFILFRESRQSENLLVGRIVDVALGPPRSTVNIFRKVGTVEGAEVQKLEDGSVCNIPELLQTQEFRELRHHQDVVDFAFVFPPKAVVDGLVNCSGISNAFICRYLFVDHTSELVEIEDIVSFPSLYSSEDQPWVRTRCVDCVGLRIWRSVSVVQDILMKMLNRQSERQGLFARAREKVPLFPPETWLYLSRRAAGVIEPIKRSGRRVRQRLLYGMKMQTKRVETKVEILRFETDEQLIVLRKILGIAATVGVRRRKARIDETKYIQTNDALNIVTGSDSAEDPFTLRTEEEGIDLVFDQMELVVICRYSKYVYSADDDGEPVDCPCDHVEALLLGGGQNPNLVDDSQESLVVIGSMFQFDNVVLRISSVKSDEVVGEVVAPSGRRGERITFTDKGEVSRLVVAYNSS